MQRIVFYSILYLPRQVLLQILHALSHILDVMITVLILEIMQILNIPGTIAPSRMDTYICEAKAANVIDADENMHELPVVEVVELKIELNL